MRPYYVCDDLCGEESVCSWAVKAPCISAMIVPTCGRTKARMPIWRLPPPFPLAKGARIEGGAGVRGVVTAGIRGLFYGGQAEMVQCPF